MVIVIQQKGKWKVVNSLSNLTLMSLDLNVSKNVNERQAFLFGRFPMFVG